MSSDVHIQVLGFQTMKLNTLYINNIALIRDFNESLDEKLINLFMNKKEMILKDFKDMEEFNKFFAHYEISTNESSLILSQLIIVGLYSSYERSLKSLLSKTGFCPNEEHKKFFKYKNLKKYFSKELEIEYEDWQNPVFCLLEEIRCINNCIKHSGIVDEKLNQINNKWVVGEEIKEISKENIAKFIDVPHLYLKIIVDKIKEKYFN